MTTKPITGLLTTHQVFTLNNNPISLTGGGLIPLSAGVTGLYIGTGRVLHVRATGIVDTIVGATGTVELKLWQITAAGAALSTLTNATILAQTGGSTLIATATALPTATGATTASFNFDARLQLSSTGLLAGQFTADAGGTVQVYATNTAVVTGLTEADLNFFLSIANTNSAVGNATLKEFAIDLE